MPALDQQQMIALARSVITAEERAVHATLDALDGAFVEVARLICDCQGKVLVTGSGTSGALAARAAHLLSVSGAPAFHLPPADGLHGGLGVLRQNDLVLALSKGGASDELNEFCARSKQLCGVIAITAVADSPLAAIADHVIVLPADPDADLGGIVATGSTLAAGAVLDAICAIARVAGDYDWEKVLFTHPGGAVGRDAEQARVRLSGAKADE